MIWSRLIVRVAVAVALAVPVGAATESLVNRLLRVSGLTAAPGQMRGPGDEVEAGNIWIVNLDRRTTRALTADGGYRSPVFSPADGTVYALKGDAIVRIPAEGSKPVAVRKVSGALKLVGFDGKSPDEAVLLLDNGAKGSPLVIVSLKSGGVTPLSYDAKSDDQRRMLAQIRGQDRVYGDTIVYTKTETKRGLSRNIEWTDVYLRRGNAAPQNISACDGVSCVQPVLSPDGRNVAYVKSEG
jgi:hypothetical protein